MPLDMPASPGFVRSSFGLEAHTQTFTSPLTRNTQRLVLTGGRWRADYTLPKMNARQAGPWMAFLDQCEGMANTFNAYDPDRQRPLGAGTGTPLVKSGSQTGSSLTTDGWTSSTLVLKAGDYFSVNNELKRVTADVTSDGSGNATVTFKPALRSSPADDAPLTLTRPTCTMILEGDNQGFWECDHNGIYQEKTFSAYEVF